MNRIAVSILLIVFLCTSNSNANDDYLLRQEFDGGWKSGDIEFTCSYDGSEYSLLVNGGIAEIIVDGELQPLHAVTYSPDIVVYLSGNRREGTAYVVHLGKNTFAMQTYGAKPSEDGKKTDLKC